MQKLQYLLHFLADMYINCKRAIQSSMSACIILIINARADLASSGLHEEPLKPVCTRHHFTWGLHEPAGGAGHVEESIVILISRIYFLIGKIFYWWRLSLFILTWGFISSLFWREAFLLFFHVKLPFFISRDIWEI
jgi:hypothetical protein